MLVLFGFLSSFLLSYLFLSDGLSSQADELPSTSNLAATRSPQPASSLMTSVPLPERDLQQSPAQAQSVAITEKPSVECVNQSRLLQFPLPPLERELQRLAHLTAEVMAEARATYWPVDGTLLGVMRNGRVSTDRDLDFSIQSTYDQCFPLLSSLRQFFAKRARIKSFKVVKTKLPDGKKVGRYVMVRLYAEHGSFDTGPDFNCVYMDDSRGPHYFTHRGVLTAIPPSVYPLSECLLYNTTIPCPRDGMSFLKTLTPRYDGCMVFPHCLGDPLHSSKGCMSPHAPFPLERFVESTKELQRCGFTSLASHWEEEASCQSIKEHCRVVQGGVRLCFLQPFSG